MQLFLEDGLRYLSVYKGDWANDLIHGRGIMYDHDKQMIIIGFFKEGSLETQGDFKVRYPNNDVYEGAILNMKRNGRGRLFYANGDIYEGEWQNGMRNGPGKLYIKEDDTTVEGLFADDQILQGKMTDGF